LFYNVDNPYDEYEVGPLGVLTGSVQAADVWSLLSLLLSLFAFICAALILTAAVVRREWGEDMWSADMEREHGRRRTRRLFRTFGIASAFGVGAVWLASDDIGEPMAWISASTVYTVIAFAVFISCLAVFASAQQGFYSAGEVDRRGKTHKAVFDMIYEQTGWLADRSCRRVNAGNEKFGTMALITLVFAALGAILWFVMSRVGITSARLGGEIFLTLAGVPATITAAFDRDWVFLGDDDDVEWIPFADDGFGREMVFGDEISEE
jgi:hypothetical protein